MIELIAAGRLLTPVWRPVRTFNLAWLEVTVDDKSGGPTAFQSNLIVQLWEAPTVDIYNDNQLIKGPGEYVARAQVGLGAGDRRAVRPAVESWTQYEPCRLTAGNWVICVANRPNWNLDKHAPAITVTPHGTYA